MFDVRATRARGAFLIEALVAILVFSIAAASLFTLLANSMHSSSNAVSRAVAAELAAGALARMSAENATGLPARYDAAARGPGFRALVAAAKALPGVTDDVNVPAISFTSGPSANSQRVSLTIYWQLPNEPIPHGALATSVVAGP